MNELLITAIRAAYSAGEAVMEIYRSGDFSIEMKADASPLTTADKRAHEIIDRMLAPTGIPVLSEEGRDIPYSQRGQWRRLWVVDPIDGTKEFIKRNGEFTVNIALVEDGLAVMGVILVPATDELYFSYVTEGAYRFDGAFSPQMTLGALKDVALRLPCSAKREKYTVIGSRSHATPETDAFIQKIRTEKGEIDFVSKGSSLKFCLIAEGSADLYPRFAPTLEWDTAAGTAIVLGAGGTVTDCSTGAPIRYNRPQLLNPWFVVKR